MLIYAETAYPNGGVGQVGTVAAAVRLESIDDLPHLVAPPIREHDVCSTGGFVVEPIHQRGPVAWLFALSWTWCVLGDRPDAWLDVINLGLAFPPKFLHKVDGQEATSQVRHSHSTISLPAGATIAQLRFLGLRRHLLKPSGSRRQHLPCGKGGPHAPL